jgi:protein-disulfide isomerase
MVPAHVALVGLSLGLAACTPAPAPAPRDPTVAALEARVAALEAAHAQQAPHAGAPGTPDLTELAQRVDDLEVLARETRALQQDMQLLVMRVAERAASSPPPVAASPRSELLDPQRRYRIAIAGSPSFGAPAAPVTIVAAVQVPERFTHELWPVLHELRAKYGDQVRVVFEGFVVNPQAQATTIAACAAARQGSDALDKLEDALWDARELAQTDASKPWPDLEDARAAAGGKGLDLKAFDADVAGACAKGVDREQRALAAVGQNAAPVLWINGRPMVGAQSPDRLAAMIDDELAKAKADHDKGGAARTYYDRLMKTAQITAR